MGGRVAWLEEGGREKNVRAAILSLGPPKLLLSPNWGENEGEKGNVCFGLNCHFSTNFLGVLISLFVLFFFLVLYVSFILILFSFSF